MTKTLGPRGEWFRLSKNANMRARPLVEAARHATGVELLSRASLRTHTLAFVWGASKLPRRLIKGAKEMKQSIKVTLSLHPAHTYMRTHTNTDCTVSVVNDSFVNGVFKMSCALLLRR